MGLFWIPSEWYVSSDSNEISNNLNNLHLSSLVDTYLLSVWSEVVENKLEVVSKSDDVFTGNDVDESRDLYTSL